MMREHHSARADYQCDSCGSSATLTGWQEMQNDVPEDWGILVIRVQGKKNGHAKAQASKHLCPSCAKEVLSTMKQGRATLRAVDTEIVARLERLESQLRLSRD